MAVLASGPVEAQEPQLARVLAIAPEAVTLSLEPADGSAPQTLVVPLAEGDRPSGIRVGGLVRLWPESEGGVRNGSLAGARLDVPGGASGLQDRTGVRARLMQGTRPGAGGAAGGGRGGR